MRVRAALAIALLVTVGALVLDMSGRAQRIAATDHSSAPAFVASVAPGGTLCQPLMVLPADARRLEILVGTYGHPVPRLAADFRDTRGQVLASGTLREGAHEGYVQIPLGYQRGVTARGTLCLHVGRVVQPIVFGGEPYPASASSEQVDDHPQSGRIDVVYLRGGRESWWQLLPTLDRRFAFGKSDLFGGWTLPAMALLLLAVWVATVRLLLRELKA